MRLALAALALFLGACASRTAPPPAGESATVIVLVRHAEKAATPAADPGLTDAGRARALALADALDRAGVEVLVASQFRRTVDTLAPLAARLGEEVRVAPLEGDPAEAAHALALDLLEEYPGRTVVVAGHSNTIPSMVSALTGEPMADLADTDYDGLYVVVHDGARARLVRAQVGAPDPER